MSRLSEYSEAVYRPREEDYRGRRDLEERYPRGGLSGWMVAGLVLAGAGALAWYYLGPDVRRYLKIRSM
jgi:hypothetical protein